MGAYLDNRILNGKQIEQIMDKIMLPAISQMSKEGSPFTGFLYAGLMMTADGPKVLEFNARLGDPEAQVLMHHYDGDLAQVLAAATRAENLKTPTFKEGCSVCVVTAAANYPDRPRTGDVIHGIGDAEAADTTVFQAGTADKGKQLVTSGGRVLGVTASQPTLEEAIRAAYSGVGKIHFDGMQYRPDIGQKGLRRW